ncbi:hypothetical protein HK096_003511 [Nowakowskiella sp. JEL0078]|nr:hypothetical protein HK096_003511 [Nowakowskiella sp. JEL0078]
MELDSLPVEEASRKLASIQLISSIQKHHNADSLSVAQVLGWQVVIKTGEFKENDKVIYLEIDSICPPTTWSKFLEPKSYIVKTIKLRGELSQGLCISIEHLPFNFVAKNSGLEIGLDVTKELGIKKRIQIDNPGWMVSNGLVRIFPPFVPKTEETRIQSEPRLIEKLDGLPWVATMKIDGTSATYFVDPETKEFFACSRNLSKTLPEILDPNCQISETGEMRFLTKEELIAKAVEIRKKDNEKRTKLGKSGAGVTLTRDLYWDVALSYSLPLTLPEKYPNYAIQGEIYGPGIQGNPLGVSGDLLPKFAVFSVYDWKNSKYLGHDEMLLVCSELGLDSVPVIVEGEKWEKDSWSVKKLLEGPAKGLYPGSKNPMEGVVIRNKVQNGIRISFKVINNEFLLKAK